MDILIATHNLGKLKEFQELFSDLPFHFHSLSEFENITEVCEDGLTLMENALIKAKHYFDLTKMPTISDDTGLFIDALNGLPGLNTARFSGFGDKENRLKVLNLMQNETNRHASFRTCLAFYDGNDLVTSSSIFDGEIAFVESGEKGFGYDSIFKPLGYNKTVAELDEEVKNKMSHRYLATVSLKLKLELLYGLKTIEDLVKQYFKNYHSYEILQGGMSNTTLLVETNDGKFVFRIPGLSSEIFVNREIEIKSLNLVKEYDVFRKVIYFDNVTGISICQYNQKTKETSHNDIFNTLNLLHGLKFDIDFNPFKRLDYYERLNKIFGISFCDDYQDLKNTLLQSKEMLEARKRVFCHNDCQLSNFLDKTLIDFEYCGNNDYLFDYACFGNNDLSISKELINIDSHISDKEEAWKIVQLWYSLQALSWYNVALFKDYIGFSKQMNMDFKEVALMFLNKAKVLLKKS